MSPSLPNRLSRLKCLDTGKVQCLALVAVLAGVGGTEENQLILGVAECQAAVGFGTAGESVDLRRGAGDHHGSGRQGILLVLLRGHHEDRSVLVEGIGVDVPKCVLPVSGRIQDDESRLVGTFLVGGVLIVLPSRFIGDVRLGERAGGIGVHAPVFPDRHGREIHHGEGVLSHILGLFLSNLFLPGLGELRLYPKIEPLTLRVEGCLRAARDADLPAGRPALPLWCHIPDIECAVSFLRIHIPH